MDSVQRRFAHGVEYCVTATRVSYERLAESLMTNTLGPEHTEVPPEWARDRMILDAWSMVDWANRLHGLVDNFPGLKRSDPAIRSIILKLKQTEDFRNYMQHLEGDLRVDDSKPVWGVLKWSNTLSSITAHFGDEVTIALGGTNTPPLGPKSVRLARPPFDLELTDLARSIATFGERFKRSGRNHNWNNSEDRQTLKVEL